MLRLIVLIFLVFGNASLPGATKITGKVKHPTGYNIGKAQKITSNLEGASLSFYAKRFAQGHAVYVELVIADPGVFSADRAYFLGLWVDLVKTSWGYRALFGIKPWEKPGLGEFKLAYKIKDRGLQKVVKIKIEKTRYPVYRGSMVVKNWSNTTQLQKKEVVAMKAQNRKKKTATFKKSGPDTLGPEMAHPRDMHKVTSAFYAKRVISRFKKKGKKRIKLKPRVTRHWGLDLKGLTGAKIFALMPGRVVIAEKMFFEGGFVVLDHGNKIFSGYMHQSKILVKEGDRVAAGQTIGLTGATGAVTGPHLHIFLRIRGIYVDPLTVLPLPIRE